MPLCLLDSSWGFVISRVVHQAGEVGKMNGFFKQQWHLIKAVIKGRSESLSLPSACCNSIQEFCATFG